MVHNGDDNCFLVITSRPNQVLDHDGPGEGLDAGHLLPEREDGPLPQHHRAQCVCPHLSQRQGFVQHQVRLYVLLSAFSIYLCGYITKLDVILVSPCNYVT